MDLQDLLNLAKDLPPAGSLELYQLLNEKECTDERRRWDQAFADTIYRSTHRTSPTVPSDLTRALNGDKEAARQFLYKAGFTDKEGNLRPPYCSEEP